MVRVAVIGAGTLGIKIAGELAYHGHEVRLHDSSVPALDGVQLRLAEDRRALREDGILNQPHFVGDVFCLTRLEETVKAADFIIEAISEELTLKQDIFEQVSQCCRPDAILATCSMRLSVDAIAERASQKDRCLGMRFLYPVYCIPEVELVLGSHTSLLTLERVRRFLERMGKTAFMRSGPEPLVLTEEEREARRQAFAQYIKSNQGHLKKMLLKIPDLNFSDKGLLISNDSEDGSANVGAGRDRDCVVCMDDERNCVLHPCHHLCTCATCGRMLLKRQDACPICRKHIVNIFRVFHS